MDLEEVNNYDNGAGSDTLLPINPPELHKNSFIMNDPNYESLSPPPVNSDNIFSHPTIYRDSILHSENSQPNLRKYSTGNSTPSTIYSDTCGCDHCPCDDPDENLIGNPKGKECVCGDPSTKCEDQCLPNPEDCPCSVCLCERPEQCTCNPCECVAPPIIDCTCNPCECDVQPCKCDPCECDVPPDETGEKFDVFSPRDEREREKREFFAKLQENLNDIKREFCKDMRKPLGVELTEDLVVRMIIRERNGKGQVYLPGNQVYPSFLKRRIEDQDIPCIVNVLLQLRSVVTVNLAYNNITDLGLTMLATAIQECGNIENVNLMNNDFTSNGVIVLAQALLHRPPLSSLRLSGVKYQVEGIDGLACLIMSGHSPKDLDLSESDLSVEGFQVLCTALHALDHGIDYPNFLLARSLPIDLVSLQVIKQEFNENMGQMRLLDRSKSETDYLGIIKNNKKPGRRINIQYLKEEEKSSSLAPIPEVEQFSANVLEGLFDIRHRLSEEHLGETDFDKEYRGEDVQRIFEESRTMGDLSEIINEFNATKHLEGEIREHNIISPSLCELDVSSPIDFADEVENSTKAERHRSSIAGKIGKGLGHVQSKTPGAADSLAKAWSPDDDMPSPDEFTAEKAAREMTDFLLTSALAAVGRSEFPDSTNAVQLVLMSIGDVAHLQREREDAGLELTENECTHMLDNAMERVTNLLSPEVPPETQLDEEDLKKFISAFFKSTHITFMKLFKNPYLCRALAQEGTLACRERIKREAEELRRPYNPYLATNDEVRYIAMQFLDGAIREAGRMIGTGDPFGFGVKQTPTNKHNALHTPSPSTSNLHATSTMSIHGDTRENDDFAHALKTLLITEEVFQTEDELEETVKTLIETSGRLAAATTMKAREIQEADQDFKLVADVFTDDLFNQVFQTIKEYQDQKMQEILEQEADENSSKLKTSGHYPHISRPTRLVLNRPFFHNNGELMATKLGDYLRENNSVRSLHIQKWSLGEDGMVCLMNGILLNTTLVLLDLANNELGADGVKLLGTYLGVNKNLSHLILNHNRLKDPGILHLVENMGDCGLLSLNIAYNNITWVGLDPLLTVLPFTKIRALYLWGNSFGLTTWDLLNSLFQAKKLLHSDLCLQVVDGRGCVVKDSKFRSTNYWYEVPPQEEKGFHIPTYYLDRVHDERDRNASNYVQMKASS